MVEYTSLFISIVGFFLLLILGLTMGHIISNVLKRFFHGMQLDHILKKQFRIRISVEQKLVSFAKYVIYAAFFIAALTQLGIPTRVFQFALLGLLILVLLFLLFSFKDWIPSVLAGLYILQTKKIKRGDTVETQQFTGKVVRISLLETKFRVNAKEEIFVPNSLLVKQQVRVIK